MNEWKELEIDDLSYVIKNRDELEVQFLNSDMWYIASNWNSDKYYSESVKMFLDGKHKYRYRRNEPLPPTHIEIMTRWWKDKQQNVWLRVTIYDFGGDNEPYFISNYDDWVSADWFIGRESASVPAEE